MQPCKTGDQPYSDASPNGDNTRLQQNVYLIQIGEVSLYGWSPVLQVWVQLLHYIQITTYFLALIRSSLVKLETSSDHCLFFRASEKIMEGLKCLTRIFRSY